MEIKDAWALSMLHEAGYLIHVNSGYVDGEVHCIDVKDADGEIAVSEDEAVTATFDSEVFSEQSLLEFGKHDVKVTLPCPYWSGNMNSLSSELEHMASRDGYMDAFLEEYKKQPNLLENF